MGRAALARGRAGPKNRPGVENLLDQIDALIGTAARDLDEIERTLTDGYARALSLEAEQWRIGKRIQEVAQSLQRGDTEKKARELASLAKRLDGNTDDLTVLRTRLAHLRRHADEIRVG